MHGGLQRVPARRSHLTIDADHLGRLAGGSLEFQIRDDRGNRAGAIGGQIEHINFIAGPQFRIGG
jgi:hypothetical protein